MSNKPMRIVIGLVAVLILLIGVTAQAQDDGPNTVNYNGFSFSYPQNWITSLLVQVVEGTPVEEAGPGFSDAAHTAFTLADPFPPEGPYDVKGGIKVYETAELAKYDFLQAEVEELRALLEEKPDLEQYEEVEENVMDNALPYVPVLPHGQIIRAKAQYVETESVRGISFITSHRNDAGPFLNGDLVYVFQGLSADGEHYISAQFQLITSLFPEGLPADYDPAAFEIMPYMVEAVAQIDAATADQFLPSLDTLDGIVNSFSFGQ